MSKHGKPLNVELDGGYESAEALKEIKDSFIASATAPNEELGWD